MGPQTEELVELCDAYTWMLEQKAASKKNQGLLGQRHCIFVKLTHMMGCMQSEACAWEQIWFPLMSDVVSVVISILDDVSNLDVSNLRTET